MSLAANPAEEQMGFDPVCKMEVEPARAAAQSTYEGQVYYFCALECKKKFDQEPERYVGRMSRPAARAERKG